MTALGTAHVGATKILLYGYSTLRTSMSSNIKSPILIHLFLCLSTSLFVVPWSLALKTHVLLACWAFYLCGRWLCVNYALTIGLRTKLLILASCYLILHEELAELFI
jgi:hypothetical protein